MIDHSTLLAEEACQQDRECQEGDHIKSCEKVFEDLAKRVYEHQKSK